MTLKRRLPKPTAEQQERQNRCLERGCIACRMAGFHTSLDPTIHHQTAAGQTIGQDHTVCLCEWHHESVCLPSLGKRDMTEIYGPSLADGSKLFFAQFGSNAQQLDYQDEIIGWTKPAERYKRHKSTAKPSKQISRQDARR